VFVSRATGPELSTVAVGMPLGVQVHPPYLGAGLLQLRVRFMDPVHESPVQRQLDQTDHSDQPPSEEELQN
jgi:hypothetical protein